MSSESKSSSRKKTAHRSRSADLRRPFDRKILAQAKSIASDYRILLEADEDAGYFGRSLEMPGVMADGSTPTKCVEAVREALATAIATMIEQGETPPLPAREERRTSQLNIRLTPEEKEMLEAAAIGGLVRLGSGFASASMILEEATK